MPMIDVYATTGTFATKHQLAQDLAKAVMRWEGVPAVPPFLDNTAAFIHELPLDAISNAAGRRLGHSGACQHERRHCRSGTGRTRGTVIPGRLQRERNKRWTPKIANREPVL